MHLNLDGWQIRPALPWVPEPRNLDEMKLVRGKERRKKGGSGTQGYQLSFLPYFFFLLFFGSGTQGSPACENRSTVRLQVAWVPRTQVSGKEVLVPRNTNFGKRR